MNQQVFLSGSPAASFHLGERIGGALEEGSILALCGELGCGKTLLTRGICAGLGVPEREVNSPTFTLVNEYQGRMPVLHLDMYRLAGLDEELELGFWDYLSRAERGVMLVEWAEKVLALLPKEHCRVEFTVLGARRRRIALTAGGGKYARLFEELRRK